jgi:hypothetical protein
MLCHRFTRVRRMLIVVAALPACACLMIAPEVAVKAVASEIRQQDLAVRDKLKWCGNTKGEGTVVYVKSETDCGPQYAWLRTRGKTFAFDDASQELTPSATRLSPAIVASMPWLGWKNLEEGRKAAHDEVCLH